jgi:hypothetical protein
MNINVLKAAEPKIPVKTPGQSGVISTISFKDR